MSRILRQCPAAVIRIGLKKRSGRTYRIDLTRREASGQLRARVKKRSIQATSSNLLDLPDRLAAWDEFERLRHCLLYLIFLDRDLAIAIGVHLDPNLLLDLRSLSHSTPERAFAQVLRCHVLDAQV